MYQIEQDNRKIDGYDVPTFTRRINNLNILEVEAGSNGYKGGDTGHGCRTYFRIEDLGGTDLRTKTFSASGDTSGFEVVLGGDCELHTIIQALKFITKALEDAAAENYE